MTIGNEINDLLQEIAADEYLPPLEDDDLTIPKVAASLHLSETGARGVMERKVKSGLVRVVEKRGNHGGRIQTFVRA